MVQISRSLLDQILALAARESTEICGLLLGQGICIEQIVPADNVAADTTRQFEIDPAILVAAHRDARAGGLPVLGHYHSHPSGIADPSAADAAQASPDGSLWLIVGAGEARLWRSGSDGLHGRFTRESLSAR
jgi:proteasome lid subunit RPN8/RPN11